MSRRAPSRAPGFAILFILSALALISCGAAQGKRREAFLIALGSIDRALRSSPSDSKALDKLFAAACGKADVSSDWLSVLKRAESASDGRRDARLADAATKALKAFPRSLSLHSAAAYELLRMGRAREALALFDATMPPDARPELWAEAFVSGPEAASKAAPADYGRLADAAGDARPFLGAAAASLAAGDRLAAGAWLVKAVAGGAAAPPTLLWDCGMYDRLARMPDGFAGPDELELMGDAAWKIGDTDLARKRWARALAIGPKSSWRPYAKLAMLSGTDGELAESYWTRMKAAFLAGPPSAERDGALRAYAAHLARSGREKEASRALAGGGSAGELASLKLMIESASMPEARYAAQLERLVSSRPDDGEAMGFALRELTRRGMYGEAALLVRSALGRKLPVERLWFYEAASSAGRGEYAAALATLREGSEGDQGAEGSFAIASILAAGGDHAGAAKEYSSAASAARGSKDRCAAFKALGGELAASGDQAGAKRAYRQALEADPTDAIAALLVRGPAK